MNLIRVSIMIIVMLVASPLLFGEETPETHYRHPNTNIKFPGSLAGLQIGSVVDYEKNHPGLGVSIGYIGSGIKANIYIYNLGLTSIADGLSSNALNKHLEQVIRDIYELEKMGRYKLVKSRAQGKASFGTKKTEFQALFASFSYVQDDIDRLSCLYLTGHNEHFVKIRFTYYESAKAQAEITLMQLLREFGNILENSLKSNRKAL